jgi:hypothetical protein
MRYWIDECIATGPPDIMSARSWSGNFEYHANNLYDEERALEVVIFFGGKNVL